MRQYCYLLFILCLLSCTKKEFKDVQADSFRISVLPVVNPEFNQYQITGTLDVPHVASTAIEYGLVVGKSLNPTLEQDKVLKIGFSLTATDFTQTISNLDTGIVYYVRAYGKNG